MWVPAVATCYFCWYTSNSKCVSVLKEAMSHYGTTNKQLKNSWKASKKDGLYIFANYLFIYCSFVHPWLVEINKSIEYNKTIARSQITCVGQRLYKICCLLSSFLLILSKSKCIATRNYTTILDLNVRKKEAQISPTTKLTGHLLALLSFCQRIMIYPYNGLDT